MGDFITQNWAVLLLAGIAFADVIVSLTPSKRDDAVLGYVRLLINAITAGKNKKI